MSCKTCGVVNNGSNFYASNKTRCKECVRQAVQENRKANIDYYKAFEKTRAKLPHRIAARKAYQKTEAYKKSHFIANKKYLNEHPNRDLARNMVSNAIRDKKLFKLPCLICGEEKVEGHHPDYSRPLDVIWLCNKHHREAHALVKDCND